MVVIMKEKDNLTIVISPKSIALFTLIPLGLYFLWFVRDLIFSLLIGFILMSALRPAVAFITSYKLPRTAAVFIVYILFIVIFGLLISLIIPPIIIETANLLKSLPFILKDVNPDLERYTNLDGLTSFIPNVTNNIFSLISVIFSNTFFVISTLFFGLYFLLEENLVDNFMQRYLSSKNAQRVSSIFHTAEKRMSSWFWGQVSLMIIVGVLTFIGLNIVGMKYALPLAVLAGLLEVIPNLGPIISAIPAVIIGMSISYFTGFSVLALYIIVQQLENSLIVPMIMKRAVGLNPILTLIALLVGGRIGGVLGVLLAIPLLLFVETIVGEMVHFTSSGKTQE